MKVCFVKVILFEEVESECKTFNKRRKMMEESSPFHHQVRDLIFAVDMLLVGTCSVISFSEPEFGDSASRLERRLSHANIRSKTVGSG